MDNDDIREKKVKFTANPEDSDYSENDDDLIDDTVSEDGALFVNPLLVNQSNK